LLFTQSLIHVTEEVCVTGWTIYYTYAITNVPSCFEV